MVIYMSLKKTSTKKIINSFLLLTSAIVMQPAMSDDHLQDARTCDTSGCYLAWNIVDSDKDGVSDADELMAGTDPYNAEKTPTLRQVIELIGSRKLPSFEGGRGYLLVFPPEVQALREQATQSPLSQFSALPLGKERKDILTQAGISTSTMKEFGIDVEKSGFTLGLDLAGDKGYKPPIMVNGVDVKLVSAEDDPTGIIPLPDDKNLLELTKDPDGSIFWKNKDGSYGYATPNYHGAYYDKDGAVKYKWYTNPDVDNNATTGGVSQEEIDAWAKVHLNTNTYTVENNDKPEVSNETPENPWVTVMYIEQEIGTNATANVTVVTEIPRVTKAQPESDPNLPNPEVNAPPTTVGCSGLC